ncbi:hypothetical protein LWC34_05295 [Kibdelosporangium philippinense]|uniref:Acyl carrier protein n=1 Tax=Kibdelosporangium philippinense TaxID=211113 RepID=A0ABS8Z643_9PSEU|nr:hypothetical protein [Kibdelosporangium philippinense]MCE7002245.1 hypothetical protein [Kibdelosporangium philippinense]
MEIEARVRAAVAHAMRVPLDDWPADKPLTDVPDGMYDSLAKLDAVGRLELELDSGPLPLDEQAGTLDTITALTEWVLRKLDGRRA